MAGDATAEIRVVGDFSEFDREVERRQNMDRTSSLSFGSESIQGFLPSPSGPAGYLPPPLSLPVPLMGGGSSGADSLIRAGTSLTSAAARLESAAGALEASIRTAGGGGGGGQRRIGHTMTVEDPNFPNFGGTFEGRYTSYSGYTYGGPHNRRRQIPGYYQGEEVGPGPIRGQLPGEMFDAPFSYSTSGPNRGSPWNTGGGGGAGGGGGGGWGSEEGPSGGGQRALPWQGQAYPRYEGYTPGYGYPQPGTGNAWHDAMRFRNYAARTGGSPYRQSFLRQSWWQRANAMLKRVPQGAYYSAMFGLWEVGQATQSLERADVQAQTADDIGGRLAAGAAGLEGATSGPLGSIMRLGMDFGMNLLTLGQARGYTIGGVISSLQLAQAQVARLDRVQASTVSLRNAKAMAAAVASGPEATELAQLETSRYTQRHDNLKRMGDISLLLSEERAQGTIDKFLGAGGGYVLSDPGNRAALTRERDVLKRVETANEAVYQAERARIVRQQSATTAQYEARFASAFMEAQGMQSQAQERINQEMQHRIEIAGASPERVDSIRHTHLQQDVALMRRQEIDRNDANREINMRTTIIGMQSRGRDVFSIEQRELQLQQQGEIEAARSSGNRFLIPGLTALHTAQTGLQNYQQGITMQGLMRQSQFRQRIASMVEENAGLAELEDATAEERAAAERQQWQEQGLTGTVLSYLLLPAQGAERTLNAAERRRRGRVARAEEARRLGTARRGLERAERVQDFLAQNRPTEARFQELENQRQDQLERTSEIKNFQQRTAMENQINRFFDRQFEVERRDYLRSFRAEQINLTKLDVTNARDQEDPGQVLKTISGFVSDINNKLDNIAE
jgi:hypothetical protein